MTPAAEVMEGVQARARRHARQEVRAAAMALMVEQGFDATSVEDIVRSTGVSRRTFYRYFGTREDLVLGSTEEQRDVLVAALVARPAGEDPWTALQRAAEHLPDAEAPARSLAISRLVLTTPALRARYLETQAAWRAALAPVLVRRSEAAGAPLTELAASALVACALTCLSIAAEAWMRGGGTGSLDAFYRQAVAAIRTC